MHREWKDFMVGKLRTNCGMCLHEQVEPNQFPCSLCIKHVKKRWGDDAIITGSQFEPKDKQYFENLKTLFEKYNDRLSEAERVHFEIQQEISKEASALGVDTNAFYYARKKVIVQDWNKTNI